MSTDATAPAPGRDPRWQRRRGMLWPLVLVAVGLVFLLGNYGLIQPISFVSILALWPVLLILLGIDIAFARQRPLETLVAEVVIIGLALVLAATQPLSLVTTIGGSASCTDPRSAVTAGRGSFQSYALTINGGAARYHLSSGASGAMDATANYDELCLTVRDANANRGDVRLGQGGSRIGGNNDIDVKLASDLPVSLTLNAGAGEFDIDLHDIKVTDARFNIGASSTTVILPRPSGDLVIRADGGASSFTIEIPADVEARITVTGGLVSSSTTNARTTKNGNVIETSGYATAKDRVAVNVTGGATSVSVR